MLSTKEIEKLEEEIKKLKEENERLKKIEKEYEHHKKHCSDFSTIEVPSFVKEDVKRRHKKSGQKIGHKGYSRRVPERIDVIKPIKLIRCPDCNGKNLSEVQEIRERCVTDISEPQDPITTKNRIERKYCRDCKKIVEAPVLDALPNARFGLRLMLFVLFLKIGLAMPIEKILELIKNQYKLVISNGEIIHMLKQLAREFGPYYKELKEKIRKVNVRHIDETGRRVMGKNHYVWIFITKEIAYYKIKKSRGHKVPLTVLGKNCEGTNISDRHSVYYVLLYKTKCVMQACWAHLLRETKRLKEDFAEGIIIHRRLKSIYKKACSFNHKGTVKDAERLLKRLDKIMDIRFKSTICRKFIKHLCTRDREHLFRFVTDPEIDSTNNLAERGLRHDVIIRKISGGNRSNLGARIHECLLSVIQTYKLQKRNILIDGLSYLKQKLQTTK